MRYMDDGDVMVALLIVVAIIGLVWLAAFMIYREIDFARVMARSRRQKRDEQERREYEAALQRRELLADLQDYGISECDLHQLSEEEIAARLTAAINLHRQVVEGLSRSRPAAAANV